MDHYLKCGLSVVLVFVGTKMLLAEVYKVPIGLSAGVIALVLGGAVGSSLLRSRTAGAIEPVAPGPRASGPVPVTEPGQGV